MNIDHVEIQKLMRQMVDLDIADNLKLWVHNGLVKTRTSGSDLYVPKAYDISGEENDAAQATNDNQPELVSDGMEFDGSSTFLNCGNDSSLNLSNNISMCAWIYNSDGPSNNRYLLGKWNYPANKRAYAIGIYMSVFKAYVGADGSSTNSKNYSLSASENVWNFCVATFATNNLKMYVNAIEGAPHKITDGTVNSLYSTTEPLIIGAASTAPDNVMVGVSNDLRIYNKALSATEISAIYNQTKGFYGIT